METKQTVERSVTELGCNVREVTHDDGSKDITLDTGRVPVLVLVDLARTGADSTAYYTHHRE